MSVETVEGRVARINGMLEGKNYPPYPTKARSRAELERQQTAYTDRIRREVLVPELGEPGGWRQAPSGAPFTCNYWPMDGVFVYLGQDNRLHIWRRE